MFADSQAERCWDETGIMQRNVICMRGTGNVKSRLCRWSRYAAPSPLSVKLLDRNPDSCWLQNAHKTLHVAPQVGEGGGCCTEVRWKAYFVSAKHSDIMCGLMPESKYMTIHSDVAGNVPLYCQSRTVCSCVTTSFKSEPSLSSFVTGVRGLLLHYQLLLLLVQSCRLFYRLLYTSR